MTQKNAVWSPASYLNAHDSEQQTATVSGNLQYRAGVPNNARNAGGSTTHEELYLQINAGNGWKEVTPVWGGCGAQGARRFLLPASSYAHTRRLVPGCWTFVIFSCSPHADFPIHAVIRNGSPMIRYTPFLTSGFTIVSVILAQTSTLHIHSATARNNGSHTMKHEQF
jgi:hypothetical protein